MTRHIATLGLVAVLSVGLGCAGNRTSPLPGPVAVDPVITWDLVTTACDGNPVVGAMYNIYAVAGPGPIPTIPSADESPCGVTLLPLGPPLNPKPVAAPPYHAIVTDGVWTFAVQAVLPSGAGSGLSNSVTKNVLNRGAAPKNTKAGP